MPLVIEMQVKLLFAYGVRNRLFGIGIVYFYVTIFPRTRDKGMT